MELSPKYLMLRSKLFVTILLAIVVSHVAVAQVQVSVSGTNISCFGACNGTATAVGSGGWSPYSYQWSNGQSTAALVDLCPGTYVVTVSDLNSNSAVGSITILQPTQIGVSVDGQSQICGIVPDGWAAASPFSGTPPYTYSWNNSATTQLITDLSAGVYTVTVTDFKGCTIASSFTVGFWNEGLWLMTSHLDVTCFGYNNGTAHVSVMSGTPPYYYDWSNDGIGNPIAGLEDITGLPAGTYQVTVTDSNGCSNQASTTVAEPDPLECFISSQPGYCGLPGTATIEATGGTAPYSYLWDGGQTWPTITIMGGTYSVTVSDANGCSCSSSVIVEVNGGTLILDATPTVDAGCTVGGSAVVNVSGGTGNYAFVWDSNPTQNTSTATNLGVGSHQVTVTDLVTGCQGIDTVNISSAQPLIVATTIGSNATCLIGGSAIATPSGGIEPYSYDWSNDGADDPDNDNATATNLLAGTHTVTITDAGGCSSEATITILQTNGPSLQVSVVTNATCIAGGSGIANTTGGVEPYSYTWSNSANNQSTQTASNLPVGAHGVTVTDANGCAAVGALTIEQPAAPNAFIAGSSQSGCSSNTGSATAGATGGVGPFTYDWSNDGPDNPDDDDATANGLGAGIYTVTITDAAGCTATAEVSIASLLPPMVAITAVTSASCTGPGSATASVSGGNGTLSFTWDNGETTATAINLTAGLHAVTVIDNAFCASTASVNIGSINNGILLGDYVWIDFDQDGFQHPTETIGVSNMTVKLTKSGADGIFGTSDDVIVSSTTTDGDGHYQFECVTTGVYVIVFSGLPSGYQWTIKDAQSNDCKDSDVKSNGATDPFTIGFGQGNTFCFDAGIHTFCHNIDSPGTICCNQTICEGQTPSLIVSSLPPIGGSGTLEYMWLQFMSIGGALPNWISVPGAMSETFQPGPLFESTRFMRCARRGGCSWVESNFVNITVKPAGSPGCGGFISDFTVNRQGPTSVQVNWTTLPEATEYGYTVQHSTNMIEWADIANVAGKQDPLEENDYAFLHKTPANGRNLYRIKRATASGQIAYSPNRETSVSYSANETVRITPNPVMDKLKIINLVAFDEDVTVTISSTKGDILHTITLKKGKLSEIELEVSNLPSGIYLARVIYTNGAVNTVKIAKF
jgi:hypothetical protein